MVPGSRRGVGRSPSFGEDLPRTTGFFGFEVYKTLAITRLATGVEAALLLVGIQAAEFSNVTWTDAVVAVDLDTNALVPLANGHKYLSLVRDLGTTSSSRAASRYKIQLQNCDWDDAGVPDCDLVRPHLS